MTSFLYVTAKFYRFLCVYDLVSKFICVKDNGTDAVYICAGYATYSTLERVLVQPQSIRNL